MNKSYLILAFASFLSFFTACKSTKESTAMSDKMSSMSKEGDALEKSLLWKISGKNIKTPSFLYGTIHLIGKDDFFYPKGTLAAFEEAEDVVFEIDMNEMSDMGSQMGMLQHVFMSNDTTLKDLLTETDYNLVNTHFSDMGLPMFMLEKFKPMFLTVFASGDMDMGSLLGGGDQEASTKSYEFEFFELAKELKKDVSGLETMEFQMSIFEKIPYSAQAEMLVEAIKAEDTGADSFQEMVVMYKNQDITAMINMMDEEAGSMGGYDDILLVERNKNWIPIITKMMTNKSVFFAVGAGHLAGKNGVINLLKKQGYTLTPLSAM